MVLTTTRPPKRQWYRSVTSFDGQNIVVDGQCCYTLGNYLGGGVAGVVYEAENNVGDNDNGDGSSRHYNYDNDNDMLSGTSGSDTVPSQPVPINSPSPGTFSSPLSTPPQHASMSFQIERSPVRHTNFLRDSFDGDGDGDGDRDGDCEGVGSLGAALGDRGRCSSVESVKTVSNIPPTVALKILNPVGYRLLPSSVMRSAIVVKKGEPLAEDSPMGQTKMSERHVWWVVNPGSRGVRELLQQGQHAESENLTNGGRDASNRDPVTLPLIAAYYNSRTQSLRELPLTRCIEIWGHAPFGGSEREFNAIIDKIEDANNGKFCPAAASSGGGGGDGGGISSIPPLDEEGLGDGGNDNNENNDTNNPKVRQFLSTFC